MTTSAKNVNAYKAGHLFRWANYMKGYKKRWFVLRDGYLSYYRNESEVNHHCRGTINVGAANIHVVDKQHFVIANRGSQTFYLRAPSVNAQKEWLEALRLSKTQAMLHLDKDLDTNSECSESQGNAYEEVERYFNELDVCLQGVTKSHKDMDTKCDQFCRLNPSAIGNGNFQKTAPNLIEQVQALQLCSKSVVQSSQQFNESATVILRRFKKLLKSDEDRVGRLEQMIEDLARQHSRLETQVQQVNYKADVGTDNLAHEVEENELPISDEDSFYDADETFPESDEELVSPFLEQAVEKVGEVEKCESLPLISPPESEKKVLAIRPKMQRRTSIPPMPVTSVNLWSIVKNSIGKDLSRIPMPVNFSEPLSMLQRLTEDYEYAGCLDKAAELCEQHSDSLQALGYVAAFTIAAYASTAHRVRKPFNPLLGETYECDRTDDLGWRCVAEQISHHPPTAALFCESGQWTSWQHFTMSTKFRGKNLQIHPQGMAHVSLPGGHHIVWRKVRTTVHNIVVGKLWMEHVGHMDIINCTTGEKCRLYFRPYSYFDSKDVARLVTGVLLDVDGRVCYVIKGAWDSNVDMWRLNEPVMWTESMAGQEEKLLTVDVTRTAPTRLWTVAPLPPNSERMYNFSRFAITLNEPEADVAPTDSRRRPDQVLMEQGRWDEANHEKQRLEHQQRQRRSTGNTMTNMTPDEDGDSTVPGATMSKPAPVWFEHVFDTDSEQETVNFTHQYWDCKARGDWSRCPHIF